MGKYGSEVLELKIENERLKTQRDMKQNLNVREERNRKKRQDLEEETKRFNGPCYLIKQSFQTFLETAEEYSICFIMLHRPQPQ